MIVINKLAFAAAVSLAAFMSASAAQIPAGFYTNTFSGPAALYDPTGTHTQSIAGISLVFTLNMDEKGKLTGGGTAFVTDANTNQATTGSADVSCKGTVKTVKGVSRASFTLKLKGSGGTGTIKENLEPDPANQQMAGTATGTVAVGSGKGAKQKLPAIPVTLNLPIGADGSCTLEMTIAPNGTKYTGGGSAAICGCKTYPVTVSGTYNARSDTLKLILKGEKQSVNLTLNASEQNGQLVIQSLKGKMLGQSPHIP